MFDDKGSRITDALSGRTIDHVIRKGKEIEFICTDGHVITLQADVNFDIHLKHVGVKIMLPGVSMASQAGMIGKR